MKRISFMGKKSWAISSSNQIWKKKKGDCAVRILTALLLALTGTLGSSTHNQFGPFTFFPLVLFPHNDLKGSSKDNGQSCWIWSDDLFADVP